MSNVSVNQAAEPRRRRRDMSHWTMTLATLAFALGISAFVFGRPVLPNTRAADSPAAIKEVTYLSAGEEGSVWLAVGVRESGLGYDKTALYRMSSAGQQWKKVLEVSGHGTVKQLWFFGAGRVSAWLGEGRAVIMRTADGGVRWDSSPEFSENLSHMSFINPTEGWMLSVAGAGMSKEWSAVRRTVDGGNQWTEVALVLPDQFGSGLSSEYKTGIEFRDANNGWIGTDPSIVSVMPYLYLSQDKGATWKRQSLPPPTGPSDAWTGRIFPPKFFGVRTGVALALLYGGQGQWTVPHVYATSDGGRTWGNPRPFPIKKENNTVAWDFFSPTIWAAALNQMLWLTSDAGRTWSARLVPLPPTYEINRVAFAGPARVWVIGSAVPLGGHSPVADYVLETPDAGLHWNRVVLPQPH